MPKELRTPNSEMRHSEPGSSSRRFSLRWQSVRRVAIFAVTLIAFNLLCRHLLPAQIDLTQRRAFTLSPQTRNLLAALKSPVNVVLLAPKVPKTAGEQNFQSAAAMFRELAETYSRSHPLFRVQELDPTDSAAARQWQQQFPDLVPPCVLVAIDSGAVTGHEMLTARDIAEFHPGDATRPAEVEFFGEQALTAALARLTGGKKQVQVYVTTGHGELSLDDAVPESRHGLGVLAQLLRQLDCQVEPLDLAGTPRVPHDASLVLVAGGERPWNAAEAGKLDKYLRQGGRALVLADFHYDSRRKRPAPCGLEELLSKYGVALRNDRVVTRNFSGAVETASPALPAAGDHPLVRALPQAPVVLYECRSLSLSTGVKQWSGKVVPLLVSHAAPRAWADGDFGSQAAPEPGGLNDADGPVAMALAVERKQEGNASPVLVIAGDAAFVSNRVLSSTAGRVNSSFVLSCVNWLRGRRELLGDIPPQRHEGYRLTGSPDDHRGLVWKSSLLLCAVIATSGVTVWTTRRVG
jgi:hypothetical protein